MNIKELVKEFLDYFENNTAEVLEEYILMTWFIGQDKEREKEFEKLRNEINL